MLFFLKSVSALNFFVLVTLPQAARKDKTAVPSVQETVKKIILGQVSHMTCVIQSWFETGGADTD